MTLLQLRYVLALDRHRHFQKAADACNVTQPSLSEQVQNLEEELGAILFDRNSRPITPTEIGEQVITHARSVIAKTEQLETAVQETTGQMAGELRVGILSTISPYLMPLVIAPFSDRYPDVSLIFRELLAGQIIDHLQRDLLDVGLISSPPSSSRGITEQILFEEPLVGYVAPGHRLYEHETLRIEDLHRDDLWLMSEGHRFREHTLQLLKGEGPEDSNQTVVQFESGNLETLQRLVDRGYGMTLLPWLAVQEEGSHAPGSVRPFEGKPPTRTIRLVYPEVIVKRHLVRAFASTVRDAVAPVLPDRFISE
jgi:LysR family hydrogen peroxide-inducible transcriptional activator